MPGFDGTGPRGLGPRTGGGFGFCPPGAGPLSVGYAPGFVYGAGRGGIPWGGGRGRAFGGGRGWWWRARFPYMVAPYWTAPLYPTVEPAEEKVFLESQVASLEQQLEAVRKRLDELATQVEQE